MYGINLTSETTKSTQCRILSTWLSSWCVDWGIFIFGMGFFTEMPNKKMFWLISLKESSRLSTTAPYILLMWLKINIAHIKNTIQSICKRCVRSTALHVNIYLMQSVPLYTLIIRYINSIMMCWMRIIRRIIIIREKPMHTQLLTFIQ